MSRVAVIYWSGTGNTERMARAVADGARGEGADAELSAADSFDLSSIASFDAIAFGCPAMEAESLEGSEFEPMFASCVCELGGRAVGLFGSYGWGGGEWMTKWEERCAASGIELAARSVICRETPDDDALARCRELGMSLVTCSS